MTKLKVHVLDVVVMWWSFEAYLLHMDCCIGFFFSIHDLKINPCPFNYSMLLSGDNFLNVPWFVPKMMEFILISDDMNIA